MTLLEYLNELRSSNHIFDLFQEGEFSEIISLIYTIIRCAVIDGAEELSLTSTHFTWGINDQTTGDFFIGDLKPDVGFRESIELVMKRDKFLAKHFEIYFQSSDKIIYRIRAAED